MSGCLLTSLVCWEDPVTTAAVFLPGAIILVALSTWSLIYIVAWTGLLALMAVVVFKVVGMVTEKLDKPNPLGDTLSKISKVDLTVSQDKMNSFLGMAVDNINCATSYIKKAILVEEIVPTAVFGMACYLLTYMGSWFNALTLVLIAWVLLFSVPKLYLNNQVAADELYAKVKVHVDSLQEKVFNKPAAPLKKED